MKFENFLKFSIFQKMPFSGFRKSMKEFFKFKFLSRLVRVPPHIIKMQKTAFKTVVWSKYTSSKWLLDAIVKNGHFLVADDNQFLLFKGMKPRDKNMRLDATRKRQQCHRRVGADRVPQDLSGVGVQA